jgi:hypothetical protein
MPRFEAMSIPNIARQTGAAKAAHYEQLTTTAHGPAAAFALLRYGVPGKPRNMSDPVKRG